SLIKSHKALGSEHLARRRNRLGSMKSVIIATIMLVHSWYPGACCHDQDCHPVPCDDIKADVLGLSWGGVIFTGDMIRDSMDESYHVCIHSATMVYLGFT